MSNSGKSLLALVALLALQSHAFGATYSLAENTLDMGGGSSGSSHYRSQLSFGAAFSEVVATNASGARVGLGYVGQLNDPPISQLSQIQRQPGAPSEILISYLLGKTSDPEGDSFTLLSVSPVSLQGVPIERTPTSIIYQSTSEEDTLDSYTYIVADQFGAASQGTVILRTGNPGAPLLSISMLEDTVLLSFQGLPARTYQILATDSLTPPLTWRFLAIPTPDFTGRYDFVDPEALTVRTRFYRLLQF